MQMGLTAVGAEVRAQFEQTLFSSTQGKVLGIAIWSGRS